jgi:putative FmdB family regulatory protein
MIGFGIDMPIYEYKCPNCEKVFEQFRKMDDPDIETAHHGACSFVARRIPSVAHAKFTGSGFYETDYKHK